MKKINLFRTFGLLGCQRGRERGTNERVFDVEERGLLGLSILERNAVLGFSGPRLIAGSRGVRKVGVPLIAPSET